MRSPPATQNFFANWGADFRPEEYSTRSKPFTFLALLVLSLSVTALAQTPGDENGTGQAGIPSESSELTFDAEAATEKPKADSPSPEDEGRDLRYYLTIIVSLIVIYKFFKHREYKAKQPRGDDIHDITHSDTTESPPSDDSPDTVSNFSHLRNLNFTGRVDLLDRLHEALASGQYAAFTQTQAITRPWRRWKDPARFGVRLPPEG